MEDVQWCPQKFLGVSRLDVQRCPRCVSEPDKTFCVLHRHTDSSLSRTLLFVAPWTAARYFSTFDTHCTPRAFEGLCNVRQLPCAVQDKANDLLADGVLSARVLPSRDQPLGVKSLIQLSQYKTSNRGQTKTAHFESDNKSCPKTPGAPRKK